MAIKTIEPKKTRKTTKKRVSKIEKLDSIEPLRIQKNDFNSSMSHKVSSVKRKKKDKGKGIIATIKEGIKNGGEIDYTFLLLAIVLTILGLVMLLSASTPAANIKTGRSYFFFIRQFVFVVAGLVAMYICSVTDYRIYKKYAYKGFWVGVILLILVLIPHIGVSRNGSRRWINFGILDFQPSELVKFLVAVFFAYLVDKKKYDIKTWKGLFSYGLLLACVVGPIMLETHLSGAIVISGIALCILIVGGANMKIISVGAIGALGAGSLLVFAMPSRMARVTSFIHPFADPQGKGYQIIQSLYAIGSGGVFGRGLGQSMQKYSFLPEPYNDFIFAVISEELGLVGAIFIILLFAGLIIRGMSIALKTKDTFGMLLGVGIVSQIAIQTILNIAVVTSSVPNTGVTLPFFSYGGTAILILLAEIGVVLNISKTAQNNN